MIKFNILVEARGTKNTFRRRVINDRKENKNTAKTDRIFKTIFKKY